MHAELCERPQTEPVSPWVRAHQEVLDVALVRAGLERREGICLLAAFRQRVHHRLGFGAFGEYTDRHLGYTGRTAQDKLRTAEALEHLPRLARAQHDGQLHASAVRELARVATAETEAEWIQAASGRRVREIERLVAGHAPGDRPTDKARPELERHVLRFEVSGETLAAFRSAMHRLRQLSDEPLDDDTTLLMIARGVLYGATPRGDDAEQGGAAKGDAAARGDAAAAMNDDVAMSDDGTNMNAAWGDTDGAGGGADAGDGAGAGVPSGVRDDARSRDINGAGAVSGSRDADGAGGGAGMRSGSCNDARSGAVSGSGARARELTGRAKYQIAVMVCECCQEGYQQAGADQVRITSAMLEAARCDARVVNHTHVGAEAQPARTQTIPPTMRRRVLARDRHRCQVPGCRNTLDVDVHHIVPRADGGTHAAENLIVLCAAHHRAVHAGHLDVAGSAPHALVFRHADGTLYGDRATASEVDMCERVFRGLRGLGFKEAEAKRALARARAASPPGLSAQELLKLALVQLAPRSVPRA